MFKDKSIHKNLLCFDIEWVPDPMAAELLCGTEDAATNPMGAFEALWAAAGATEEQPRPWVKTMLSRVVSIAGILRESEGDGGVQLKLIAMPSDTSDPDKCSEHNILRGFLKSVGDRKPQLVGYNSINADIPILLQRGIVQGLHCPSFAERPAKPWEGADYFDARSNSHHIDLYEALGGRWKDAPRLHEAATLCGIPGKMDVSGDQVWELYRDGHLGKIIAYNECDAFTTYLLWARMAHFSGLLNAEAYAKEQELIRGLLEENIAAGKTHLEAYLERWEELSVQADSFEVQTPSA